MVPSEGQLLTCVYRRKSAMPIWSGRLQRSCKLMQRFTARSASTDMSVCTMPAHTHTMSHDLLCLQLQQALFTLPCCCAQEHEGCIMQLLAPSCRQPTAVGAVAIAEDCLVGLNRG